MSTNNEELFEGLQIMSAAELNSAVKGEENEGVETSTSADEEFSLEPVVAEKGDDSVTTKTVETTTETKPNTDSTSKNEVVYKALMKELVNAGVLTVEEMEKLDEMPGNFDSIKELVNKTVETNFKAKEDNWKKSLSPAKKRFLEIEDAFDETDQAILMAQRLEFFDNVSEDAIKQDENLQKQIYWEQLKAKNFSDADALEAIEDAVAINKLEEKALKAVPELKASAKTYIDKSREAIQEKTKAEQEAQTKAFEQLLSNIDSRETFIDGLNLNKVAKDKLKNNIMNPVHTDPKTGKEFNSLMYKQQRNPVEFEMLINYYDTLGLFNLDKEGKFKPDISKLKQVAKTAAINDLDKIIAAEEERGVGRNTSVETSKKTEGILSMLDSAFKNR
jgi:glutaminase